MLHGPTYFESKGSCIYCNATGTKLTDEHIVPYSLGGQHVIREASCLSCANITKKFEQKVARDLWGDARISFNLPTRNKKSRQVNAENLSKEMKIPIIEYPAGFVFYKMKLPGLLQGLPEDEDISKSWKLIMIDDDNRRKKFLESGKSPLILKFRHVPQEFGQLLCKIAYGQVLTTLDLKDFNSICLPYITGEKTNVSYVVGDTMEKVQPILGIGYSMNTSGLISSGRMLLIVRIRLYANTYAPEYQVIVGDVVGNKNICKILQKLGPGKLTSIG